jgi:esterase
MELNYKQTGIGEPLIILHGLFGMLDNWQTIAKRLGEHFEVYTLDLRNHGKSPHSDEHSYAIMARDVYDFMEDQNLFKAHILGHSMGGKVAMQFASYFPGFVNKLIIADMFPKSYTDVRLDHERIFEAIDIVNACPFKDRKEGEQKLRSVLQNDRIYHFVLKNLKITKNTCPEWKFNATVLQREYKAILDNIKISLPIKSPTLFLKAELSNYILEDEFQDINKIFPNAELITISRASHWLHADKPDDFCKHVYNYLSE